MLCMSTRTRSRIPVVAKRFVACRLHHCVSVRPATHAVPASSVLRHQFLQPREYCAHRVKLTPRHPLIFLLAVG